MAWVCVNENGQEVICDEKPFREYSDILPCWWGIGWKNAFDHDKIWLPKGSIKKLIGRDLNWSDEPVEIK